MSHRNARARRTVLGTLTPLFLLATLSSCGWLHRGAPPQPHEMIVTIQPEAGRSGEPLATQPTLMLVDDEGEPVPVPATLTLQLLEPGQAELTGTTTISTVDGVATFGDLTLTGTAGVPITLQATSDANVSPVDLNPVTLTAGAAARLRVGGFAAQQLRNIPFDVYVELLDDAGNLSPAVRDTTVSLRAESTSGEGELRRALPTPAQRASSTSITTILPAGSTGVTFADVLFTGVSGREGLDVRIVAEAEGLASEPSPAFSARDIELTIAAADEALEATGEDTTAVTVTVTDALGTPVSDADVTLMTDYGTFLNDVADDLGATIVLATNAEGAVTSTLLTDTTPGVATLTAMCPGACTVTTTVLIRAPLDVQATTLTVSPSMVTTSPTTTATLTVELFDTQGARYTHAIPTLTFAVPTHGTIRDVTSLGNGRFEAIYTPNQATLTTSRTDVLQASVNGMAIPSTVTITQAVPVPNDFYLDANGVTIRCPDAADGDTGTVNGVTYTKYTNKITLRNAIKDAHTLATRACTSGIGNLGNVLNPGYADDEQALAGFNEDISHWDTTGVTALNLALGGQVSFNHDISAWDVSAVTNMNQMLNGAKAFNQDLTGWCVSQFSSEPSNFSKDTNAWDPSLHPKWGTCP